MMLCCHICLLLNLSIKLLQLQYQRIHAILKYWLLIKISCFLFNDISRKQFVMHLKYSIFNCTCLLCCLMGRGGQLHTYRKTKYSYDERYRTSVNPYLQRLLNIDHDKQIWQAWALSKSPVAGISLTRQF